MIDLLEPGTISLHSPSIQDYSSDGLAQLDSLMTADSLAVEGRWNEVFDELERARNFGDDWDGQGARAPAAETIDAAEEISRALDARGWRIPDDFGASVDGTVTLGWYKLPGSVVIVVHSLGQVEGYRWKKGDEKAAMFSISTGK